MALSPGTRLGCYEIVVPLGAGGMGEVYRARDRRLDRSIAIKILPDAFATDPERIARFEREAKTLAALNHPLIAQIYGVEESAGIRALVMELVDGPTIADRIARGPIPIEEALPIAKQIAEALEAAHEQGIVHRDLKPANIKLKPDGTVKVLDFGLAKLAEPATAATVGNLTQSPTITTPAMTQMGVILGTAAYMSPEQARGKQVDKRADIWAFGCVVFEMLAATHAFAGDDVTDTIVTVVSKEPDWNALPVAASGVRPLLARCLTKDPKQRLQAIGEARIHLEQLISGATQEATLTRASAAMPYRRLAAVAIAALAGAALTGALMISALRRAPAPRPQLARFEIVPPPSQALELQGASKDITISPDGQYIVYRGSAGPSSLLLRAIDRLDARPLAGVGNARWPFFSADGRWVGVLDGSSLKKVSIAGGSALTIYQGPAVGPNVYGASWGDDNNIVFGTRDAGIGLQRVSANGGEPTVLTRPNQARGEANHIYPFVLPGSRAVLFTIGHPSRAASAEVAVLDLTTGQQKTLIHGGSHAQYIETGHLLYAAAGTLRAVRFDLGRLEVLSDPVPVAEDVWMSVGGAANYEVSRQGTLVYVPAGGAQAPRSLVWVDRKGHETPIPAPARLYNEPRLSPDGTRIALSIGDQESDIWIWDVTQSKLTRLTFDPSVDHFPVWTPDGQRIIFASLRAGSFNLFTQAADNTGTVERLTTGTVNQVPAFVAPDGTGIVGSQISSQTAGDIVLFRLNRSAGPSLVEPLVQTKAIEYLPELSPNGRYIAYQSDESGPDEIYVRPFPHVNDGRWQVSAGGGTSPMWARNGRELFYLDVNKVLTAIPVQTSGETFAAGNPIKLLETAYATPFRFARSYDVSPDGRFLMIKDNVAGNASVKRTSVVVVLNWQAELMQRVPTR